MVRGILVSAIATSLIGLRVDRKRTASLRHRQKRTILAVLENMASDQSWGMKNVSREDGRLLRLLTETTDAKRVVEIGTSNGYSAIWFCLALRTTGGRLITHEIDPEKVALARDNFKRAGVEELVTIVEGDAHQDSLEARRADRHSLSGRG